MSPPSEFACLASNTNFNAISAGMAGSISQSNEERKRIDE